MKELYQRKKAKESKKKVIEGKIIQMKNKNTKEKIKVTQTLSIMQLCLKTYI